MCVERHVEQRDRGPGTSGASRGRREPRWGRRGGRRGIRGVINRFNKRCRRAPPTVVDVVSYLSLSTPQREKPGDKRLRIERIRQPESTGPATPSTKYSQLKPRKGTVCSLSKKMAAYGRYYEADLLI